MQERHFADGIRPNVPQKGLSPSKDTIMPNRVYEPPIPVSPELPSSKENRRRTVSKRLSHLMDNLQDNIFIASQRLNDLTGYSGIEALKATISKLEANLGDCQQVVRAARDNYRRTVEDRAASQREVTALLSRKDTWTPIDVERFTSLCRSDHDNEQAVREATAKLNSAEQAAEQTANKLSSSILIRYHEEQIWSDKIRRMSTWGTLGLMGVNVLLFLVFQFGFEPWRRRKLMRGLEDKVKAALEMGKEKQTQAQAKIPGELESSSGQGDGIDLDGTVTAAIHNLEEGIDDAINESLIAETTEGSKRHVTDFLWRRPVTLRNRLLDVFGEGIILLRKRDITIIALESAAAGAALSGMIAVFLLRRN